VIVGDKGWRLFSSDAQPIGNDAMAPGWHRLTAVSGGTPCDMLRKRAEARLMKPYESVPEASRPRVRLLALEDAAQGRCIAVTRFGNAVAPAASAPQTPAPRSEVVVVTVYLASAMQALLLGDDTGVPTPVATWKFDRQAPGRERDWWVGDASGPWEGWLAATPQGSLAGAVASPFSTAALKRIADGILKSNPAKPSAPASSASRSVGGGK